MYIARLLSRLQPHPCIERKRRAPANDQFFRTFQRGVGRIAVSDRENSADLRRKMRGRCEPTLPAARMAAVGTCSISER
jgi:hypothetical protein